MQLIQKLGSLFALLLVTMSYLGCSQSESDESLVLYPKSDKFASYWYQGKAELNRYDLQQVRYGEIRKGDAVLIFVTEDFLKTKQVKYEFGDDKSDVKSVLKLNFNKRFFTGIYPYSLLTSTFLPIQSNQTHALKVTFTSQEWCGHMFMQLNNRQEKFSVQQRSYFQAEGDKQYDLEPELLEDEVWTLIRVNPDLLPVGEIEVLPSMDYVRLFHKDYKSKKATIQKEEIADTKFSSKTLFKYSIRYQELPRSLSIYYEKEFPYQILAWEETYNSNEQVGEGNVITTKAVRTNKLMLDYWNKNSVADSTYRIELGLKQ